MPVVFLKKFLMKIAAAEVSSRFFLGDIMTHLHLGVLADLELI